MSKEYKKLNILGQPMANDETQINKKAAIGHSVWYNNYIESYFVESRRKNFKIFVNETQIK